MPLRNPILYATASDGQEPRRQEQKHSLLHGLLSGILLLALSACSHMPPTSPAPSLATLPPATPSVQRLTFEHADKRDTLLGVIRHDHQQLQLALLSSQGQRLLTLVRDEHGSRFLPDAVFDPPFSADWLASRLTWSLWPEGDLQDAFNGTGWALETAAQQRRIYYRGRLVALIDTTPECRVIDDIEAGYRLYIAPTAAQNTAAQGMETQGTKTRDNSTTACPPP
ncbi:DUF3261 domain-containing protein [Halomonas binhaiensis]|uniref:DUF3261 domain-containing protein n=2 Tax=Halomonas binhaiensis TaxID=2562282 RepID=A0A5C1NKV1_9GAMM|nr:DUF3261 domain-containing protein [Halomonas binhaiensis]